MSSTDLIVVGMCLGMIALGIAVIRLSKAQRGMGAIGVALGVIGLLAYITADEGAPPRNTTPTAVTESASPTADATP